MKDSFVVVLNDEAPCCPYVNRNRHNVDLIIQVRNGVIINCYCSWCLKEHPAPDTKTIFDRGWVSGLDSGEVYDFRIGNVTMRGKPYGDKYPI